MQTPRVNWNPPLTQHLVAKGVFRDQPFCLVDVGASGGIDGYWEVFGPDLRAFGFDGLIKEVERLNAAAMNGNRRYYPYLVGDKSYQAPRGVPDTQPFPRTSAARTSELEQYRTGPAYFDQTGSGQATTEMIELDQFFLRDHPTDVDFIKIDTDGSDYQVLRGARRLLSEKRVLGVGIECQFHGLVHEEANTFRNIDRLVTGMGFSLFDIEVYRYSRAKLPKPFVYRIPAQTHSGQVLWGDALYLRDAGSKNYERDWSIEVPAHKIIKLICVFEIFGLDDCAAEALLKYRNALSSSIDVDACLDILTPPLDSQKLSYARYIETFERNPIALYPAK